MTDFPHQLVSVVIPVFRDGSRAHAAVDAMLLQSLPNGIRQEIIVVDDGSDDDTPSWLADLNDERIQVLSLPYNQGRSAARNAGAAVAAGDFIVFMDCDCIPSDGYLAAHAAALATGAVASTGHVTGAGKGFWHRYQQGASLRRRDQHASGILCAGSSQNLAVRRCAFEAVRGFSTCYQRYGFEDRDLLMRIAAHGVVAWAEGATVHHQDSITLSEVTAKMADAGEYSSLYFAARHPVAYERLGYAAFDARLHPGARWCAPIATRLASAVAIGFDSMHLERWLPYFLARWIVQVTSALSYFGGTARGPY